MWITIRKAVTTVTVVAAALVVPIGAAQAASPTDCVPGFSSPGLVTQDEGLSMPRIQAGLAAGTYTEEELAGVFAFLDRNDDGLICLKAVSHLRGNSGKHWAFFYLAADNR